MTKVRIRFDSKMGLDLFINELTPYLHYINKVKYKYRVFEMLSYQFSFVIDYTPVAPALRTERDIVSNALRKSLEKQLGSPYELKMKTKKGK